MGRVFWVCGRMFLCGHEPFAGVPKQARAEMLWFVYCLEVFCVSGFRFSFQTSGLASCVELVRGGF